MTLTYLFYYRFCFKHRFMRTIESAIPVNNSTAPAWTNAYDNIKLNVHVSDGGAASWFYKEVQD